MSSVQENPNTNLRRSILKKPTLSAKHSKFMVFGFAFIKALHENGTLSDEGLETSYTQLKLFDDVETQSLFYEQLATNSKENGKGMRNFITQRTKPPKAPRKTRAKKETDPNAPPAEKKASKPRVKKTTNVVQDTTNDLVSELVAAANETDTAEGAEEAPAKKTRKPRAKKAVPEVVADSTESQEAAPESVEEAPTKKTRKPRAKKAVPEVVTESQETQETAPKKTRKPRAKKTDTKKEDAAPLEPVNTPPATPPHQSPSNELEEEEEVTATPIEIQGITYLIDDSNTLYSMESHNKMGTYNRETNEISCEL